MVTVFTLPSCPQCDTTKRFLKREGIEYNEVDLSQDEQAYAEVKELGYTAAPVVRAGNDHWSGFRIEKLRGLAA